MSFVIVFTPRSNQDLGESVQWYNAEKENLGFDFYRLVNEKINQIASNPLHFQIRFKTLRAAKVHSYPYLIYFEINNVKSSILILGILHTSRNPTTIKKRK